VENKVGARRFPLWPLPLASLILVLTEVHIRGHRLQVKAILPHATICAWVIGIDVQIRKEGESITGGKI
jgi:hypothetical protein